MMRVYGKPNPLAALQDISGAARALKGVSVGGDALRFPRHRRPAEISFDAAMKFAQVEREAAGGVPDMGPLLVDQNFDPQSRDRAGAEGDDLGGKQ